DHAVENRPKVADRAGDHEDVPKHVLEFEPLPDVEDDARRIGDAAGHQQPEAHGRQYGGQRLEDENAAPADGQIKHQRHTPETLWYDELQGDADEGGAPHQDREQLPVARSGENGEEWRVGAGDEQEDGRLIEPGHHFLEAGDRRQVEGERNTEHQQQRHQVDNDGRQLRPGGSDCGKDDEYG